MLYVALKTKDSLGRTPLAVSREILPRSDEERESVQRWDAVAGCPPDWGRCVDLLEAAEEDVNIKRENQGRTGEGSIIAENYVTTNSSTLPMPPPSSLLKMKPKS
eukprot:13101252-Ditylum_brightwellii.AAC.1